MRIFIAILIACIIGNPASASVKLSKNMDLCKSATYQIEKKFNIPENLLRAISLTESGRWVEQEKANIAWPWTVASGRAGEFFPSKRAAIEHVKKLQAQGVKNIDVGCMQINLRYHPNAFQSLEEAFDPHRNANYAADFLSRLFNETKSWTAAAGRYHSSEPTKNMYYREKVIAYWNHANTQGTGREFSNQKSYHVAQIDHNRTDYLNNQFRQRMENQQKAMSRAEQMSTQISEFRNNRRLSQYTDNTLDAAKNRARARQKQKKLLTLPVRATRGFKKSDFSLRRSAQLDKWRKTVAKPELLTPAQPQTVSRTQPDSLLTQQ